MSDGYVVFLTGFLLVISRPLYLETELYNTYYIRSLLFLKNDDLCFILIPQQRIFMICFLAMNIVVLVFIV